MKREINRSKKKGENYIYIYKYKMILPYKFCWKQVFVQIVIRFNLKERRISESQQSKLILSLCSFNLFSSCIQTARKKIAILFKSFFHRFWNKIVERSSTNCNHKVSKIIRRSKLNRLSALAGKTRRSLISRKNSWN